jgi:hypothetical protein
MSAVASSLGTSALGLLLPTAATDPRYNSAPAGFNVLQPRPVPAPPGPSQFQKALDSLKVSADTYLIQSALSGYRPPAAPAAFGSPQAYYQSLNQTAQDILSAAESGNFGNVNALA